MSPLVKGAIATAVRATTSVVAINYVDPAHDLYSKSWFLHLGIAVVGTIIIFESKYWKQWADKILGNGGEHLIADEKVEEKDLVIK